MRASPLFVILLLSVCSCKKEDNTAPTIDHFTLNGEFVEASVDAGSQFLVQMEFSDNDDLNQYRFSVNENFSKANGFEPYNITVVENIRGNNRSVSIELLIPDSAISGPYLAELDVVDQEGNQGETGSILLNISNVPDQPVVQITAPDLSQVFPISKGDTLELQGTINDNIDLDLVCISLGNGSFIYNESFSLSDTVQTVWNFDELDAQDKRIIIPTTAQNGDEMLTVQAKDNDEHLTVHQFIITIVD